MRRSEWFESRGRETLACFPPETARLLREFDALPGDGDVGPATVAIFVSYLYTHEALDEIAAHLGSAGFFLSTTEPRTILHDVVVPVCAGYRRRLPLPRWWWTEPFELFFPYYMSRRVATAGEAAAREELSSHWRLEAGDAHEMVLAQAAMELPDEALSFADHQPDDAAGIAVRQLAKATAPSFEWSIESYHPIIAERDDLRQAAHAIYAADAIAYLASERLAPDVADAVTTRMNDVRLAVATGLSGMSPFEMEAVLPQEEGQALLEASIQRTRNVIFAPPEGVYPLPDLVDGEVTFPTWIRDYVFSGGGRLMHSSAGPIPYFFAAFDWSEAEPPLGVSFDALKATATGFEFQILYHEASGGVVGMPFHFTLDDTEETLDAVLLILAGEARLDIARLTGAGELELQLSGTIPLTDEVRDELRSRVLPVLQDPGPVPPEHDPPKYGFIAADHSKSERLFVELESLPDTGLDEWAREKVARYAAAKAALLGHRVEKSRLRAARDFDESTREKIERYAAAVDEHVEEGEADVIKARERLRDAIPVLDASPELTPMAEGLGDDRAFLHLTVKSDALIGYWCRRLGDGVRCGEVDLSEFGLDLMSLITEQWVAKRSPERLKELTMMLGAMIADPIVDALRPEGVKHLVVSPVWLFEGVPIHSLATVDGVMLIDIFDTVSYVPSLRILDRLVERGPVTIESCLAMSFAPPGKKWELPNASSEVRMIADIFGHTDVLLDEDATPDLLLREAGKHSIVHVASHGEWDEHDAYCSGLFLSGDPLSAGYLSNARILADGDFAATGLVVLSACETGLSVNPSLAQLRDYHGIDGAFLARGVRSALSTLWPIHDLAAFMFMQVFYLELSKGATVEMSWRVAVDFLRHRKALDLDPNGDLERAMGDYRTGWRESIERDLEHGIDFADPFFWGAFKCSGWTWGGTRPPRGSWSISGLYSDSSSSSGRPR